MVKKKKQIKRSRKPKAVWPVRKRKTKSVAKTSIDGAAISVNTVGAHIGTLEVRLSRLKHLKKKMPTKAGKKTIQKAVSKTNAELKALKTYLKTRTK